MTVSYLTRRAYATAYIWLLPSNPFSPATMEVGQWKKEQLLYKSHVILLLAHNLVISTSIHDIFHQFLAPTPFAEAHPPWPLALPIPLYTQYLGNHPIRAYVLCTLDTPNRQTSILPRLQLTIVPALSSIVPERPAPAKRALWGPPASGCP